MTDIPKTAEAQASRFDNPVESLASLRMSRITEVESELRRVKAWCNQSNRLALALSEALNGIYALPDEFFRHAQRDPKPNVRSWFDNTTRNLEHPNSPILAEIAMYHASENLKMFGSLSVQGREALARPIEGKLINLFSALVVFFDHLEKTRSPDNFWKNKKECSLLRASALPLSRTAWLTTTMAAFIKEAMVKDLLSSLRNDLAQGMGPEKTNSAHSFYMFSIVIPLTFLEDYAQEIKVFQGRLERIAARSHEHIDKFKAQKLHLLVRENNKSLFETCERLSELRLASINRLSPEQKALYLLVKTSQDIAEIEKSGARPSEFLLAKNAEVLSKIACLSKTGRIGSEKELIRLGLTTPAEIALAYRVLRHEKRLYSTSLEKEFGFSQLTALSVASHAPAGRKDARVSSLAKCLAAFSYEDATKILIGHGPSILTVSDQNYQKYLSSLNELLVYRKESRHSNRLVGPDVSPRDYCPQNIGATLKSFEQIEARERELEVELEKQFSELVAQEQERARAQRVEKEKQEFTAYLEINLGLGAAEREDILASIGGQYYQTKYKVARLAESVQKGLLDSEIDAVDRNSLIRGLLIAEHKYLGTDYQSENVFVHSPGDFSDYLERLTRLLQRIYESSAVNRAPFFCPFRNPENFIPAKLSETCRAAYEVILAASTKELVDQGHDMKIGEALIRNLLGPGSGLGLRTVVKDLSSDIGVAQKRVEAELKKLLQIGAVVDQKSRGLRLGDNVDSLSYLSYLTALRELDSIGVLDPK